jgi:hypothetical protein
MWHRTRCCYKHTFMVNKLAHMGYKCKLRNGEEVPDSGQRERLPGGPGPAAAAHPLPEGAVRQPRRPQHQEPSGIAGRCAERDGRRDHRRRRRKLTKREAIVTQTVDKSASTDLRATKSVISTISRRSWLGRASRPPPTPNISITIASFARLKIFMGFHHSPQAMRRRRSLLTSFASPEPYSGRLHAPGI